MKLLYYLLLLSFIQNQNMQAWSIPGYDKISPHFSTAFNALAKKCCSVSNEQWIGLGIGTVVFCSLTYQIRNLKKVVEAQAIQIKSMQASIASTEVALTKGHIEVRCLNHKDARVDELTERMKQYPTRQEMSAVVGQGIKEATKQISSEIINQTQIENNVLQKVENKVFKTLQNKVTFLESSYSALQKGFTELAQWKRQMEQKKEGLIVSTISREIALNSLPPKVLLRRSSSLNSLSNSSVDSFVSLNPSPVNTSDDEGK